ncbi:BIG/ATPase V1 complex, subunit S1 [Xylariales sp. PMI_506]|nr:BIG/ATPase V1 complex, subunit S1 [Xylariales sp. PMI_506]
MRLSQIPILAACCATAHAFSNTSPFFMYSTAKVPVVESRPLMSSTSVQSQINEILASCPTERYLIVSQPGLNIQHVVLSNLAPKLNEALSSSKIQTRITLPEVSGSLDLKALGNAVKEACGAQGKVVSVEPYDFDPLPASDWESVLSAYDADLSIVLEQYSVSNDYTVIYGAGAFQSEDGVKPDHDTKPYEAKFEDPAHQELKRQTGAQVVRRDNTTDKRPLFEKYQFFTPGIFMSLIAAIVLFSILGVGISALSSLEVPYGAFDKENGPAAQKKQ